MRVIITIFYERCWLIVYVSKGNCLFVGILQGSKSGLPFFTKVRPKNEPYHFPSFMIENGKRECLKHFCTNQRVWGPGWEPGLNVYYCSARKLAVPMHLVHIDLGQTVPMNQERKGGGNLPPKDFVRVPVCWSRRVHFWQLKTLKARFVATIWVPGAHQFDPQRCPAKFYGLECWGWASVGSDSWDRSIRYQALVSPSEHKLLRQFLPEHTPLYDQIWEPDSHHPNIWTLNLIMHITTPAI